ncbi:MAG: helix-turn-helix domain-containing protein [Thermoplasmatales archaeon]|nr:MAG: helix-turn-helix domain-containing protein [Thermoplasmatales archaeon]
MIKTPCEYMQWHGLTVIRKELVKCMIKNFGLSQKEAAEKLGITPASVSQYLSRKRGKINIKNNKILFEINFSAEKIINNGLKIVPIEICRICKLLREQDMISYAIIRR